MISTTCISLSSRCILEYQNFLEQITTVKNSLKQASTSLYLSLVRDSIQSGKGTETSTVYTLKQQACCVVWLQNGHLSVNSEPLEPGTARFIERTDSITHRHDRPATLIRFYVSAHPVAEPIDGVGSDNTKAILLSQRVDVRAQEMILRLDQVDFPPAAIAYRHTHPGPGIRYLVEGGLTLRTDHGVQTINKGDAWFEDADSVVEATAITGTETCFVRGILLPIDYQGRSSFSLADKYDADKPHLQRNTRHCEKSLLLSDFH